MPTYRNGTDEFISSKGEFFPPNTTIETQKYHSHPDLTLVSDSPVYEAIKELYDGPIPYNLENLEDYTTLVIRNDTDDDLLVEFNDSDDIIRIGVGAVQTIETQNEVRSLIGKGSGSGNMNVTGSIQRTKV